MRASAVNGWRMLAREGSGMAVVWLLEWDGITEAEYDDLRQRTSWDTDLPDGLHRVQGKSTGRCHKTEAANVNIRFALAR